MGPPRPDRGRWGRSTFTGPNIAADLICHEADLCEAFRMGRPDHTHWRDPFLKVMMLLLGKRLRGVAAVLVRDKQSEWRCGSGDITAWVHVDGYELLRSCSVADRDAGLPLGTGHRLRPHRS